MDISEDVRPEHSMHTFGKQHYAASQQITCFWISFFILGGFHTLSCFTACIRKLWGDGGLCDRLIDSRVYAGCTVDQMHSGKPFIRTFRVVTLLQMYMKLYNLYGVVHFTSGLMITVVLTQYGYHAVEMSVYLYRKPIS